MLADRGAIGSGCECKALTSAYDGHLQPVALKAGDNLVVTYNLTPHELIKGTSPGDQSLGIAAPSGPGDSVHSIPFPTAGAQWSLTLVWKHRKDSDFLSK